MGRFEQRISDDDVAMAGSKITAGVSLRAAAAEIPCAPSTLSVRIKKAEQAEARVGGASEQSAAPAAAEGLGALEEGQDALPREVGPVEILRGALLATKASGQPDWPTRVSAARALAALRPEELAAEPVESPRGDEPEPSIVVYDLPAGAIPVLHRAKKRPETPPGEAKAAPEPPPPSDPSTFLYAPPDGEIEFIGEWNPAPRGQLTDGVIQLKLRTTEDKATAEHWRAELAAGSLPDTSEDEP